MSSISMPNIPSLQNVGTSSFVDAAGETIAVHDMCEQNMCYPGYNTGAYNVGMDITSDMLMTALSMEAKQDQPPAGADLPVADRSQYEHPSLFGRF